MSFCNFKTDKSDDDEDDDDDFILDDSFSSDYNEEFRTNSSSSSLKWSGDARKQNEEDWLSIERILYGEESLPDGKILFLYFYRSAIFSDCSNVFVSFWLCLYRWEDKGRIPGLDACVSSLKVKFYNLTFSAPFVKLFFLYRIVGTKIELPAKVGQRNPVEYVEEVLAIDPPIRQYHSEPFRLLDHELNEKLSIRKARQASGTNQSRAEDLEKLLRITSSGITRNQPQIRPQNNKKVDRTSTFMIKQNSVGRKLSKIQEHKRYELNPITIHHQSRELDNKLSYSATSSSRMGPIINVKFLYKKPDILGDVKSVKSASKLPLYADIATYERQKFPKAEMSSKSASIRHHNQMNPNTIQLPPFNYDLDFPIIQGRGYNNHKIWSTKF